MSKRDFGARASDAGGASRLARRRAVGRAAVRRGQRGNGSAFASPRPLSPLHRRPSLLSTAASSCFFPSILPSSSSRGGGEEVFSHGLLPNCFSLTFLRYFFVRKIFGHIFPLITSFSGACAVTAAPSCKRKRDDRAFWAAESLSISFPERLRSPISCRARFCC